MPTPEQKTDQIDASVEHRYFTGQVDRDLAAWERGFNTENDFDLSQEEGINPALWGDTQTTTKAPEYASTPQTREEALEVIIATLSETEMRQQLEAVSKAIHGLRKYALAA